MLMLNIYVFMSNDTSHTCLHHIMTITTTKDVMKSV